MIFKRVNNISIKTKLFFIPIIGTVLPMFILLSFFSFQMYKEMKANHQGAINFLIEKVEFNLLQSFKDLQGIQSSYQTDVDLDKILMMHDTEALKDLEQKIQRDIDANTLVHDIKIYYDHTSVFESPDFLNLNQYTSNKWYERFSKSPQYLVLDASIDQGDVTLSMMKSLNRTDFYTKHLIKVDFLSNQLIRILDDPLFNELKGQVYLLDGDKNIVASNKLVYKYKDNSLKALDTDFLSEQNKIFATQISPEFYIKDWSLVFVMADDLFLGAFSEKMFSLFLSAIFIIGILFYMSIYISKSISERLSVINYKMNQMADDHFLTIDETLGDDEIGQTASHFNDMVVRIKNLLFEVKSERKQIDQLLKEKTKAYDDLRASMVQIEAQSNRIHDLVYVDMLTGLLSRYAIYEYLETLTQSSQKNIALMFLDVDNFKFINDTYGHELGDQVISATAEVLKKLNTGMTFARFGGDEFIGVYEDFTNLNQVKGIALKIKDSFANPVQVNNKKFYLTLSIGIASYPDNAVNHKMLIKKADLALYAAKETGRNSILFYDQSMEHELVEELEFQNALVEANKNNAFYLNYQPYFSIESKKLVGYEALIRWKSDVYGQVNPYKLITQAESMGLIMEIGEWVFRTACIFCKKVNTVSAYPLKIAINISIIQLMAHDFYDQVMNIIKEIDVHPEHLVLEMTETILIESVETSVTILEKFREAGFGIALDDFGTGYSSLSYLKSLPVTVLKIDRAFINGLLESSFDSEVVDMIIKIANNRGMTTIAEGVETQEQYDLLKEKKCHVIQGYLLSRPLDEDDAIQYIVPK